MTTWQWHDCARQVGHQETNLTTAGNENPPSLFWVSGGSQFRRIEDTQSILLLSFCWILLWITKKALWNKTDLTLLHVHHINNVKTANVLSLSCNSNKNYLDGESKPQRPMNMWLSHALWRSILPSLKNLCNYSSFRNTGYNFPIIKWKFTIYSICYAKN